MDKENWSEAAKLFEEVLKKAPEFDVVYRRLGYTFVEMGNRKDGLALLETAVEKKASATNLMSLAESLVVTGGKVAVTAEEKERAYALARRANAIEQNEQTLVLLAGLSLELNRTTDFNEAAKSLNQHYPNLMQTHYYNAIQAADNSDWIKASNEINAAEQLGLDPQTAAAMRDSGIGWRAMMWQTYYVGGVLVAIWALGLLLLFVTGKFMSAQVLRSVAAANPNGTINEAELQIRNKYKQLIRFASIYYYISIPVVIFLVLAFAGGITYFFLWLGRIPIKLVGILVIGALITVYITIKSLFIRFNYDDPGRALGRDEAPGLWDLAHQVAAQVGTRAVDEIRITPGTDMAVYENGSTRDINQDRGKRILLLGIGTLNGFSQNAFRAVLAHEYGHFSHRDTAGGEDALRVNNRMATMAHSMVSSEQATPWNIAFQFLRLYHFLFRRLSHGATRLQEILADRVAVQNYGAAAFTAGLSHVIRRSLEFDYLAANEINTAVQTQRSLVNLYKLEVSTSDTQQLVEEQFQEAINQPTTEDDTHPSPHERFALAQKIVCANLTDVPGQVWDLFTNQQALTEEMSEWVENQVKGSAAAA
jgi:tetratricopeptide (TPR) repeat protein